MLRIFVRVEPTVRLATMLGCSCQVHPSGELCLWLLSEMIHESHPFNELLHVLMFDLT